MARELVYLIEFISVSGIIVLFAFIPWTKFTLGLALAIAGAFLPSMKEARQNKNASGEITFQNMVMKFNGGIRIAVVMGGLIVLTGAMIDAKKEYVDNQPEAHATKGISVNSINANQLIAPAKVEATDKSTDNEPKHDIYDSLKIEK